MEFVSSRTGRRARLIALILGLGLVVILLLASAGSAFAASFTVTNVNDSGDGSLRQCVEQANFYFGSDTILFDAATFSTPQTIILTSGQLALTDTTGATIVQGPGQNVLTVNGNHTGRVFYVGFGATAELRGLTITNGYDSQGGGICNLGNLTVQASTVTGNATYGNGDGGDGGGIYSEGTLLVMTTTVSSNDVVDNSYWAAGGGICVSGTATVVSSTISGNQLWSAWSLGLARGGGLCNINGAVTVVNSTISGNSAYASGTGAQSFGGGVCQLYSGTIWIVNCTVSSNVVSTVGPNPILVGAGICGGGGGVSIRQTIVAGNIGAADLSYYETSQGFNLVQDRGSATLASTDLPNGTNPLLGPLADNGGPTRTHALLPGSPAKNAGNNNFIPLDPSTGLTFTTDQRGAPRIVNGVVDIGAYESATVEPGANAGGPYTVAEGGSVVLTGTGSPPESIVKYEWDLNDDFVYDATGPTPTLSGVGLADGPATLSVRLRVTDSMGDTGTDTATVTVTNAAPTSPVDVNAAANQVSETASAGAIVGITASSSDPGLDTITYSLANDAGGRFVIDAATGVVTVNTGADFDYEAASSHLVGVQAQDSDGAVSAESTFTINVVDVNDPPVLALNQTLTTISEDADTSAALDVAGIIVTDDALGANVLALSGADAGLFEIVGTVLRLKAGAVLDFATNPTLDVVVTVDDATVGATPDSQQSLSITVQNVNDAPTVTSPLLNQVAIEDAAFNYTLATNAFSDADPGDTLTYSAELSGGGALPAWLSFDEGTLTFSGTPANADVGAFTVRVTATDLSAAAAYDDFTITVQNVNDAPTSSNATVSTNEDTQLTFVATDFSFSDADAGDILEWVKIATLETAGALKLNGVDVVLDQEIPVADIVAGRLTFDPASDANGSPYTTFGFQVSDGEAYSAAYTMTVNVTAVNDAPVFTSLGTVSVPENTTYVLDVNASDIDSAVLYYSLAGGVDALTFTIDSMTGVLRFLTAPDYEHPADLGKDNVYDVMVQVSDGSLTATQSITVRVLDVDETPFVHNPTISSNGGRDGAEVSVPENTTAVADLDASDPDEGAVLTFSIAGGPDAEKFVIDPVTGVLSFLVAPDYERPTDVGRDNVYRVLVRVSDGNYTDTQLLTVTVTDVDEQVAPPAQDRWRDITDEQWLTLYGVPVEDVDQVADGAGDGNFRPNALINRAQFTKMLIDGFGLRKATVGPPAFTDIPTGHFFYAWIQSGAELGLVTGLADHRFGATRPITREQACTILGRHLAAEELKNQGSVQGTQGRYATLADWYAAEGAGVLAPFVDAHELAAVHAPYTAYLIYREAIEGTTIGGGRYLQPRANLTRAQAAVMIARAR